MLKGKRIIVTGSARGMGEATLNAYVQAGADVVGMDVTDDAGRSISEKANKVLGCKGITRCDFRFNTYYLLVFGYIVSL